MRARRYSFRLLCLTVSLLLAFFSAQARDFLPVDQAIQWTLTNDGQLQLQLSEGVYVYHQSLSLDYLDAADQPRAVVVALPPTHTKNDPNFGKVEIWDAGFSLALPQGAERPKALRIRYQGCDIAGLCYPPQTRIIDWPQASTGTQSRALSTVSPVLAPVSTEPATPEPRLWDSDQSVAEAMAGHSLLWVIMGFSGIGVLLALTPCIWPMLPIVASLIVGQRQHHPRRALALSVMYVLGMALTYAVVGVVAGSLGHNLQAMMQHPAVLTAFAAVFVIFALSMFDRLQFQLPGALQTRLSALSQRQQNGGLLGAFSMGVLGALIVGPCVAPPLAGALLFISRSGDLVLGGLALFSLGLGMGAPLIVAGTALGQYLPRAGQWMVHIKHGFGLVMLAMAIVFLERVLAPAISLSLWAALFIAIGLQLGAITPRRQSGWGHLGQTLGLLLLVVGAVEMVGALGGAADARAPLSFVKTTVEARDTAPQEPMVIAGLDELQTYTLNSQTPVVAEVWAQWCTVCRSLDRTVYQDPEVLQALNNGSLLRIDLTQVNAATRRLMQHFELVGPPAVLIFPAGRSDPSWRHVGEYSKEELLSRLQQSRAFPDSGVAL